MKITIALSPLFFCGTLLSQSPTEELEMEIESIAEGNEENETDLIQIAENLESLRNNPIPVNFTEAEDLKRIPYLNVFQINNLLQYRKATGIIYSPYELQVIKGFNSETIDRVLPYFDFATQKAVPELKLKNVLKYSRNEIIARTSFNLQTRQGYLPKVENGYLGNSQNYYARYRGIYRNFLFVGFTAQQDAGEPFGKPYQDLGVDFLSGHLSLQNYGNLKSLIVGDYQAEFGQGLALWSSLAFGKSAEAVEIKRYARGLRPFTGAEENRFLRGGGITYRLNDFDLSIFYSSNCIDANVTATDSFNQPISVSSLQTTGLHRTENELADKDVNRIQIIGGNFNYLANNLSIGVTGVNYKLKTPLEQSNQLYRKFSFSGKFLDNISVDFNYLWSNLNIFGEVAFSGNNGQAYSIGFQSHPVDQFFFTLLYRNISKNYRALYNVPFAEGGGSGEQGTYFGIQWQINRTFLLKSYLDIYRFHWLRFRVDAPSQGHDLLAQLEMFFNRYFSAYVRLKNEIQEVNSTLETTISKIVSKERILARFHTIYFLTSNIRLASRIEYSFYKEGGILKKGNLIFQDIRYIFPSNKLTLTVRYALVDTESFDTRIYAYENDLTYVFSIPPYYGRSNRFYLLIDRDITQRITLQVKYSITTFLDRDEISSGLNLIQGNQASEVKLQLKLRF